MENTERLIRTWIATGKDEDVKEIVSGISIASYDVNRPYIALVEILADRTSLVNVVKGLGEYLTADEEDLRRKGRQDHPGSTITYLTFIN